MRGKRAKQLRRIAAVVWAKEVLPKQEAFAAKAQMGAGYSNAELEAVIRLPNLRKVYQNMKTEYRKAFNTSVPAALVVTGFRARQWRKDHHAHIPA